MTQKLSKPLINILVAYPYLNKQNIELLNKEKDSIRFLLDSGAFTAWKANKPIKLDDYCRFIESLPLAPWRYFTLDVIGDKEKTLKNYETMLKRGFNPVPIFTRGESPEMLNEYYKTSDVVGIGGLVGTQKNKGFINGIMKLAAGRKTHWLGFTSFNYIKHYKPYMCDSSSWMSALRFGSIDLYQGYGKFQKFKRTEFSKPPSLETKRNLESMGFDPFLLSKEESWRGGKSIAAQVTACSWLQFQRDLEKNLGVYFFLASAATDHIRLHLMSKERIRGFA